LLLTFIPGSKKPKHSTDTATDIMTDLVKVEHVCNVCASVLQGSAEKSLSEVGK